jgi:hypothetical protein
LKRFAEASVPAKPNRGSSDDRQDDEPSTLLEKSCNADLLREMIGFTAQR